MDEQSSFFVVFIAAPRSKRQKDRKVQQKWTLSLESHHGKRSSNLAVRGTKWEANIKDLFAATATPNHGDECEF